MTDENRKTFYEIQQLEQELQDYKVLKAQYEYEITNLVDRVCFPEERKSAISRLKESIRDLDKAIAETRKQISELEGRFIPERGMTPKECKAFWGLLLFPERMRKMRKEVEEIKKLRKMQKEAERITEQVNQINEQVRETNQVICNEQNDLFRRTTK
jgi:predicted  nucleic acid-binding Zn-ribbon protein